MDGASKGFVCRRRRGGDSSLPTSGWSASDAMEEQQQPVNNTFLEGWPERVWQLYDDDEQAMAQELRSVMNWIDALLLARNKPFIIKIGDKEYIIPVTNKNGFFKLIMRQPPGHLGEDLPLAFSLFDLYLVGFLHLDKWRFYDDALLPKAFDSHPHLWERLKFKGAHKKSMLLGVPVGIAPILRAWDVMLHCSQRLPDDVEKGMFCFIVVIPEAKRFPEWLDRLLHLFLTRQSAVVGETFGDLFINWTSICKRIFPGPHTFSRILNYLNYARALASVAVRHCAAQPKDPELVAIPKKTGDDSDSDKDEQEQYDSDYDIMTTDEELDAEVKEALEKEKTANAKARKAVKEAKNARNEAKRAAKAAEIAKGKAKEAKRNAKEAKVKGKSKANHDNEYEDVEEHVHVRRWKGIKFWISLTMFLCFIFWFFLF